MKGFTFIEILVTIAITMLLFSGTAASYSRFTDESRLKQAALTVKNDLRLAQNKAISGEKPLNMSCDQLIGYVVTFTDKSYSVQAQCNPNQVNAPIKTVSLGNTVSFVPVPAPITFGVLTQGVNISSDETITLSGANKTYKFTLSPQGEITDLGIQ